MPGGLTKMLRLAILGLSLIFLHPGAGSGQSLVDGAKNEKKVVIYATAAVEELQNLINGFKEKYPFLEVELFRTGSQRFLTRVTAEARAKKYTADIFLTNLTNTPILGEKNQLMKYESPESVAYPPSETKDPKGLWNLAWRQTRVLAYNTKLVTQQEAPKSYEDILNPKWKGKIGMPAEEYEWFAMQLKIRGEEKGIAFMKKLAAQDIRFSVGKTLNANLLVAGEFSILVLVNSYTLERMKDRGAAVEWVNADPLVASATGPSVAANAPHPNAAKLFVDFSLSKKTQETIIRSGHFIPSHPGVVPDPPRLTQGVKLYFEDPRLFERVHYYRDLWNTIFKK